MRPKLGTYLRYLESCNPFVKLELCITTTSIIMARFGLFALLAAAYVLPVFGVTVEELQRKGRLQVDARVAKSKTCTKENLQIRREWCVPFSQVRSS